MALQETFHSNGKTLQLSDVLGTKAINFLRTFEKENIEKSRMMNHAALTNWVAFCDEAKGHYHLPNDMMIDILKECCGFTEESAQDFIQLY